MELSLTHVLLVPRPAVYEALTDPESLKKWWGPRDFTVPDVDFDPRVGGSLRIAMQPPDGEVFHLFGEFREVEPPARLAYTFMWDPPAPDDRETVVSLSLEEQGDATELLLTQGEFATEERRALHEGGWTDSFEKLDQLLS